MDERKQLNIIKQKLNIHSDSNKLNRQLSAMKKFVKNSAPEDKKGPELTHNEIANTEYPMDSELDKNIQLSNAHIQRYKQEFESIKKLVEELDDTRSEYAHDLSSTYRQSYNNIFHVLDEINSTLCDIRSNEPMLVIKLKELNNNPNASPEDYISAIDETAENISRLYDIIINTQIPNKQTVKKEIRESEAERAEQEYNDVMEFREKQNDF